MCPTRGQQNDQEAETQRQIGNLHAPFGAIIFARLPGVRPETGLRQRHFFISANSRVTTRAVCDVLLRTLCVAPAGTQLTPPSASWAWLAAPPVSTAKSTSETATTRWGTT